MSSIRRRLWMGSFNSRAREGRDSYQFFLCLFSEFQFTRPRGARREAHAAKVAAGKFQFTRPRGARQASGDGTVELRMFQFTRPRGARQLTVRMPLKLYRSFNSRAREGRDLIQEAAAVLLSIVSIHAPARGATSSPHRRPAPQHSFQFTRPRGARRQAEAARVPSGVSIHAPARGATRLTDGQRLSTRFNSRAREGRDAAPFAGAGCVRWFQFTRPRGARPDCAQRTENGFAFQFTRPRGARRWVFYHIVFVRC